MTYAHGEIEKKWQEKWESAQTFKTDLDQKRPKYYALDMFPYPSGVGLHVGHIASYTPTDVVARYKRSQGFNVLHPMGYDAFGLPAEQYAIQTGIHPEETTKNAIENFRRQLKAYGISFDWSREVSTCDPSFYRWTQFIFLKLFERGLAYQKEVPVNWCPQLRTVLANEEVVDGKSERGGHPVVRLPMKQWMLKITEYAERLLNDLDKVDWPERTKEGQRNWIGKSEGANVDFLVELSDSSKNQIQQRSNHKKLTVFTTRPDTLFGVSFIVLAPEHPLVAQITTSQQKSVVESYCHQVSHRSEVERKSSTEKTGVFTGAYAHHPLLSEEEPQAKIPIWIADYVLMDYGTGAIMAVPGHDQRDFDFAKKFSLPVFRVVESEQPLPFEGEGVMVHSRFLNGLEKNAAIERMKVELEKLHCGERKVTYKLRDWLFSRQRYWGEPIPIIHNQEGSVPVPMEELPVLLPQVADYEPTEKGEPPLARVPEFVNYKSKENDRVGQRETDTMPGSAGSSWYFLRYTDPKNSFLPFAFENQKYWMPVDLYIGGAEHTVGHLLYSRFWQKVLFDIGLVSHDEPFLKLAHQGSVLGPDGQRMSKSRGNVVNADEVRLSYGADAIRLYICFLGPHDKDKPWADSGIEGVKRFLDRIWRLAFDEQQQVVCDESPLPFAVKKLLNKTIKKVSEDIEALHFNTAISAMMIYVNEIYKLGCRSRLAILPLLQILMPFAPHLTEEMWFLLGQQGFISLAPWPQVDPTMVLDDEVTLAVQVNGKTRGTLQISPGAEEAQAVSLAKKIPTVQNAIGENQISKVIYKPSLILNLILSKETKK
ncbi:MAG: leucine--tRNA ligase [Bdellovibrionales bacterium]|nr:leucine--tRNA ligase [Bdellovibrionales bacterium]